MDRWLAAFKLIGIGWFVSLCVVLGVLGGRWLDGKVDSGPLWLMIGLLTGIFVAFYGVYRMLPEVTYRQNEGSG
jgi:F0F1-type ATP synthase assembly protein I